MTRRQIKDFEKGSRFSTLRDNSGTMVLCCNAWKENVSCDPVTFFSCQNIRCKLVYTQQKSFRNESRTKRKMASQRVVPLDHRSGCPKSPSIQWMYIRYRLTSQWKCVCLLFVVYLSFPFPFPFPIPIRIGKSIQVEESSRTEVEESENRKKRKCARKESWTK